jgi:hypothetical protein
MGAAVHQLCSQLTFHSAHALADGGLVLVQLRASSREMLALRYLDRSLNVIEPDAGQHTETPATGQAVSIDAADALAPTDPPRNSYLRDAGPMEKLYEIMATIFDGQSSCETVAASCKSGMVQMRRMAGGK